MKQFILLFAILFTQHTYSQSSIEEEYSILLNNQPLHFGDYLSVNDFKNLKVESISNKSDLEIQFVIVPIGSSILVFRKKMEELKELYMPEMLSMGNVSEEKISHVILNLVEGQDKPALYSVEVVTRKLETGLDYFNEFKLYTANGDAKSAIWCIEQAILKDSLNMDYRISRGILFFEIGDFESSKMAFMDIPDVQANDVSYSYLASNCFNLKDYENSIKNNLLAIKSSTNNEVISNAYTQIGDANTKLFNYPEVF